MLVLKRKAGESIMIGEDVEVRVLHVEGDAVRIGRVLTVAEGLLEIKP